MQIRKIILLDTDINKWIGINKKTVVKRIFERGNQDEKKEISCFYGNKIVDVILKSVSKYIVMEY